MSSDHRQFVADRIEAVLEKGQYLGDSITVYKIGCVVYLVKERSNGDHQLIGLDPLTLREFVNWINAGESKK